MATQEHDNTSGEQSQRNDPSVIDFEALIQSKLVSEENGGSHTEWNPSVFHPSHVGYHQWLLYTKKLGLNDTSDLLGTFAVGDMIHEFIQEALHDNALEVITTEEPVEFAEDGLQFVGHADIVDWTTAEQTVVYDIKSRSNWYHFDPPVDRHVDQLTTYMRGLDAAHGQVVYVSKKDLEVRTWPENGPFQFDERRWKSIKQRCQDVKRAIVEQGYPTSEADIPFEKPGEDHEQSYFVESTTLDFSAIGGDS